jgi:DNA-binding HxlR family transcriptional regulator
VSNPAYGQYCGVARALELVGERWALLIVRDLLVGPRRFTELRRGLPRIAANVLSTRLKELEAAGIIRRSVLPRPETGTAYELTGHGRGLEAAVLALGRWGAQVLGDAGAQEVVTPESLTMALRMTFQPEAARDVHALFELRLGDVVVHAWAEDGVVDAAPGGDEDADLIIEAGPALRAVMAGEVSAAEAVASGQVRLTGDVALFDTFARLFRIGPPVQA